MENSTSDGAPPAFGAANSADTPESSAIVSRPIQLRLPAPLGVTRSWYATSELCAWTVYSRLASFEPALPPAAVFVG